jgi:hypothetical protein
MNSVYLNNKNLSVIDKDFSSIVVNECWLYNNNLISLKKSPKIVEHSFDCDFNKLITLKYSPKYVGRFFTCHHNQLNSLDFLPLSIGYDVFVPGMNSNHTLSTLISNYDSK